MERRGDGAAPGVSFGSAETAGRFGTIDVVVNNAGYGVFGPLDGISTADLEQQFRVNVLGVAAVKRTVLPIMRPQRDGVIVNLSSLGGRFTSPFMSAYYSTKFAVERLSESLAYELGLHGIRVKIVEPAHFKTSFIRSRCSGRAIAPTSRKRTTCVRG
jgi:NAD(P)-dependent dehydrogenase (short-subunit alcohol dehydrogenase family)